MRPFTDREMDQQDAAATKRAQREWREAGRVLDTLAARADALPIPLARREDAEESAPVALPYVAWVTPERGTPQRIAIEAVTSKEEALRLATLAAAQMFPGQKFHAMARPA